MNFFDSFQFLNKHPIFSDAFSYCLDVSVVKVDPDTDRIEDEEKRNTKVQIWLECGPADFDENCNVHPMHDISLDCGGDTFEDAIIELAERVKLKYGGPDTPIYTALMKELSCRKPVKPKRTVFENELYTFDDDDEFPFGEHHNTGFPFDDDDPEDNLNSLI